jgi:hypothetical protein
VNGFAGRFDDAWHRVLRAKLGLATEEEGDAALAFDLLERMAKGEADFTNTFRALSGADPAAAAAEFKTPDALSPWLQAWTARLAREGRDEAGRMAAMAVGEPGADRPQPPGGGGDRGGADGRFGVRSSGWSPCCRGPTIRRKATSTSPRRPRRRNV